jgi:prepilin-type N-terminal cleavage/methylation domain-containing protein
MTNDELRITKLTICSHSNQPRHSSFLIRNSPEGFTLLEVLVALTVLALGVAVTLSLISGCLSNIRKVQLRTRIIEHAESVMELALLDDSIQKPMTFTGDFEDGTRWSVHVQDYVSSNPQPPLPAGGLQQQVRLPVKLLSYTVEMIGPDSTTTDYRLQTVKLVKVPSDEQAMGLGR